MKIIFEQDSEDNYIELILEEGEIHNLLDWEGVGKEFPEILLSRRKLNIFVRRETEIEKEETESE